MYDNYRYFPADEHDAKTKFNFIFRTNNAGVYTAQIGFALAIDNGLSALLRTVELFTNVD